MDAIKIHSADNVCISVQPLKKGDSVLFNGGSILLREDIPAYHKMAVCDIPRGGSILKYGHPIGTATADILAGAWVHVHNVRTGLRSGNAYTYTKTRHILPDRYRNRFFSGYLRKNGSVGIRNDILILPTVGCAAAICDKLKRRYEMQHGDARGARIVVANHPYGCSQLGGDQENTQRILAGAAQNPNFGGVLVVSLGCENNHLAVFRPFLADADASRVRYMVLQDEPDELAAGIQHLKALHRLTDQDKRCDCPVEKLCIGLKCGGSDGMSGMTANPLVGVVSDWITGAGGSVIMSEIPEMFGAEQLLLDRCATKEIFVKLVRTVEDFKSYYTALGKNISENPSPGNKDGGITTLEEKSLGCVLKGGSAEIADVIRYGGRLRKPGLSVLEGPGNDLISQTALAAAGAQMILFTTGRGTPLGSLVPVVKIASNTALAQRKPEWIDFDAGQVADGDLAETAAALFERIVSAASGSYTKNEMNGYHEFAIWKNGVTL